jgi:hypothetical protein
MKAHIIENGVITNTIVVKSLDAFPNLIDAELGGSIGDLYDGNLFITPPPAPEPPKPTKEELLAQLQALQAQIMALE